MLPHLRDKWILTKKIRIEEVARFFFIPTPLELMDKWLEQLLAISYTNNACETRGTFVRFILDCSWLQHGKRRMRFRNVLQVLVNLSGSIRVSWLLSYQLDLPSSPSWTGNYRHSLLIAIPKRLCEYFLDGESLWNQMIQTCRSQGFMQGWGFEAKGSHLKIHRQESISYRPFMVLFPFLFTLPSLHRRRSHKLV